MRDLFVAIDAFLRDLPEYTGLPATRIAFTVDGFRYPNVAASSAEPISILCATHFGKGPLLVVMDLDALFFSRHQRTGERFEYPLNRHWSPVGHEFAFDAVMSSQLLARLVTAERTRSD